METIGGDGSKAGVVMKKKGKQKQKLTTGIGDSLTLDYREKKESNSIQRFK